MISQSLTRRKLYRCHGRKPVQRRILFFTSHFENRGVIARVGLNYHFNMGRSRRNS